MSHPQIIGFWLGPQCGCAGAKQIVWREDLPGLPPGPPGPDPELPYLSPFRVVEAVFSVLYGHGVTTVIGWSGLAPGVTRLTAGMLIKRVKMFNPPLEVYPTLGGLPVTVGTQAVELYEVNTALDVFEAGDPMTDGRFSPVSLRGGSTMHSPWGFPAYNGQETGSEGTIYDTPGDGVAGNGLIWQRNGAGELVLVPYLTDRSSLRTGTTAPKWRRWRESTSWANSSGAPGGTFSRTFNGSTGVRVCEEIVYASAPMPYPLYDLNFRTPTEPRMVHGGTVLLDFEATTTRQVWRWAYGESAGLFAVNRVEYTQTVEMLDV